MKLPIGLVGPNDTVRHILSVAKPYKDQIEIHTFIYRDFHEVKDIINQHQNIPIWFFSGQVPYTVAKEIKPDINAVYPQLNGSSLAKVLLEMSYKKNLPLNKISFDTLPSKEIIDFYEEHKLPSQQLKLFPYTGYRPKKELFDFHKQHFHQGKVNVCVTGIRDVYNRLVEYGIPAFRIVPSKLAIKNALEQAIQKGDILQLKSAQIAIINIALLTNRKKQTLNISSIARQRLNLKIQEKMLDFAEKIAGSMIKQSDHKYTIFTTRGILNQTNSQSLYHLIHQINTITNLSANIGIGYGDTVLSAEQNADIALQHSESNGENIVMIAAKDGRIKGPIDNLLEIEYQTLTKDKVLTKRLTTSGISISTFSKCLAIQQQLNKGFINAHDLAKNLHMTQRNARRILNDLEKNKLAKIIGEEMSGSRGRPRRLFKIGIVEDS